MAQAAYSVIISITGTPTSFVKIRCDSISSDSKQYRLSDSGKRILDEDTVPVVHRSSTHEDTVVDTSGYKIDYLRAVITFNNPEPEQVSLSGKFLPIAPMLFCHSFDLTYQTDVLESTSFNELGYKSHILGMADYRLNLSRFYDKDVNLINGLSNRSKFVIEVKLKGGSSILGRYVISEHDLSGGLFDLENVELNFESSGNKLSTQLSWV